MGWIGKILISIAAITLSIGGIAVFGKGILHIEDTWLWIAFGLLQVWLQNKIWHIGDFIKIVTTSPKQAEPAPASGAFNQKEISFLQNLSLPQKIIWCAAAFGITFIIFWVLAEAIDGHVRLQKTWIVWIGFLIVQTWVQNKIWSQNPAIKLYLIYPSTFFFSNALNSSAKQKRIKHVERIIIGILLIVGILCFIFAAITWQK